MKLQPPIKQIRTQNYWRGRGGLPIVGIVLHITDGSFQSTINHFQNKNSFSSSHYVVDDDVYQLVDDNDTAWHAGLVRNPTWKGLRYRQLGGIAGIGEYKGENRGEQGEVIQSIGDQLGVTAQVINPNFYTLGVEFVSRGEFPNVQKWLRAIRLVESLCKKWGIPRNSIGLPNHREINSGKWCPGRWFNRKWVTILGQII